MRLYVTLALVIAFSSCTKKREESFVQGHGRDLLVIADYDGKEFEVETLDSLTDQKEAPAISKSERIKNDLDKSQAMSLVEAKSSEKLLGDTPFVGLPKTKGIYKIRYQIKKDHLVLLKAAKKENIHSSELTAAVDMGNKSEIVYIPLVAYPIRGFYNTEKVDQNGEKSNKSIEVSEGHFQGAKYFKMDLKGRTIYTFAQKLDMFTEEFFVGNDAKKTDEWFHSMTVVGANFSAMRTMGYLISQASKVRFFFNKNEMNIADVNFDSSVDITKDVNQEKVERFSIERKDYSRPKNSKDNYSMTESENTLVDWSAKKSFQLDLSQQTGYRIVDMEISKNYFSYTRYLEDYKVRVKYSYLRDAGRKPFTPKIQFESDFSKFGFFNTQKHEINNYEKFKKSDFGKNVFVNRYNVNEKVIKFYFTEGSDVDDFGKSLIPVAAKACEAWTKGFQDAGVDLTIECVTDPKERKQLGDIRYNQINLIHSNEGTSLFGYGPSVTDPRTGEIISATTNMHMTSILASLVDHIREYVLFKAGVTNELFVSTPISFLGESVALSANKDKVSIAANSKVSKLLKKFPVVAANGELQELDFEKIEMTEKGKNLLKMNYGREFDMAVTGKHLAVEIHETCKEIDGLIASVKEKQPVTSENKVVIDCAKKLIPARMMGTLLHEMGHNFGLRHNFYGSVDKSNFLSKDRTNTAERVNGSSVMEYFSLDEDRLSVVGLYDVAALRYGYGDKVEVIDPNDPTKVIVKGLKTEMSIDENLAGVKRKEYKFCTDEDIDIGEDPLCARGDAGTDASEIVENMIAEYKDTIVQYNYRLNRQRQIQPERLTNYRINRFWIPMKNIYDQWRFKLADHLGLGSEYLETMDAEKLQNSIADKVKTDPEFAGYRKAADRIFNFAMEMATLPPRYCIGDRNGNTASVEFADIRRIIMAVNKYVPENCLDPKVKEYVSKKYSFTPTHESGYELEDVRLEAKPKVVGYTWWGTPVMAGPDVIGLMPEKDIAMTVLTIRAPLTYSSMEKKFQPNFVDEPIYRDAMLGYFADRISKGIKGPRLLAQKDLKNQNLFFEKFKYEKQTLENMGRSILWDGLPVPGKKGATTDRKRKFAVQYTSQSNILDRAKYKVAGLDGVTFYAIMSNEATEARKLMEMLETIPKRIEAAAPVNEKTFVALEKMSKEILVDDGKPKVSTFIKFIFAMIEDEILETSSLKTAEEKELEMHRIHWKKIFAKEVGGLKTACAEWLKPPPNSAPEDRNDRAITPLDMKMFADYLPLFDPEKQSSLDERERFNRDRMKETLEPLAKVYYDPNYQLNQKFVEQQIKAYKAAAEAAQKEAPTEDLFNFDELKTQLDLIINTLNSMKE